MRKLPLTLLIGFTTAEADSLSISYLATDNLIKKDPGLEFLNLKDRILKVIINPKRINERDTITQLLLELPHTTAVTYHLMETDGFVKQSITFEEIRLKFYKINYELFFELTNFRFTFDEWVQYK